MMAAADASRSSSEVIPLLARLVATESCDPPGRELSVAQLVHEYLQAHGVESELDEFAPGRANVLGRVRGTGAKPAMVFSAHMDTVPVGEQPWTVAPFSGAVRDGRLYGRGAADMKSALAAMLVAASDLAQRSRALGGDLILAISAGESSNCLGAKRFVERGALRGAGAMLVGEPTSLDVVTAEMSVLWIRIAAHGVIGHVSGNTGSNAITHLIQFLTALGALSLPAPRHDLLPPPSLSIGRIAGGSAINVTPDLCEAEVDIRLRPGTTAGEVVELLRQQAPANIEVTVMDFKPAVETPVDHPLVRATEAASAALLGAAPRVTGVSYYSDATVLAPAFGLPFVVIGPGELGMSGQCDEYVDVARVEQAVLLYRSIAESWLRA